MKHLLSPLLSPRSRRGFTLIELLVAVAITVLMLSLVGRIFFDTSAAVSRGVQLGKVVDSSRTISEQIEDDAEKMLGPNQGGYLVIVGKSYSSITVPGRTVGSVVAPPNNVGTTTTRTIRSDQLLFIRDSSSIDPISPKSSSTFSAATSTSVQPSAGSAYGRVWYGHVLRTKVDGTCDAGAVLGDAKNNGLNRIGTNWILGRQVMMLADQDVSGLGIASIYANDGSNPSEKDPQGNAWGQSGGELATSNFVFGYSGNRYVYEGVADVAKGGLPTIKNNKDESNGNGNSGNGNGGRWGVNRKAKKWENEALASTFSAERLRVNPTPNITTLTTPDSEQIARMHPYLMSNVSDFIVEFAGDYSPKDSSIDTDGSGNIKWYGYGATDVLATNNPNNEPEPFYEDTFNGQLSGMATNANKVYLFRNGKSHFVTSTNKDSTNWPYLIRIRYRLHDQKGNLASSSDGSSGMWFEQIIRVPRDQ